MFRVQLSLIICFVILLVQGFNARSQEQVDTRKERFDRILPQVMRENNIDMWIQLIVGRDTLDLGAGSGYCVFTDRGGDRIERAIFGFNYEVEDPEIYDIIGEEGNASGTGLGLDAKFEGLGKFVHNGILKQGAQNGKCQQKSVEDKPPPVSHSK